MEQKTNSTTYKCILHYEDGLNKKLLLTEPELNETWDVWEYELAQKELVYLKIRMVKGS